jgi:3-oxoacyl-[acyl-carrier-protein] synthase III
MSPYAHITGWGMAVPEKILTNDNLAQMVNTSDEWIREMTGIRERRIASPEQSTVSLAVEASLQALKIANLPPSDLDLIIVSTSTPEHFFPSTASLVQDRLGAEKAGAFDLLAACTGFIYALQMGAQTIRSGSASNILIVGAEVLSRFTNWQDRNTCILFGDGAGAFVLQASETPGGVLSAVLRSDGSGADLLSIPAGGSVLPPSLDTIQNGQHYIHMNGREVFRFATRVMAQATREAAKAAHLSVSDIQLIIPHQANVRIIETAARSLDIPLDHFVINLERYGNTSTASIPIATVEAVQENRLHPGDKTVFVGFGAGLTWGAVMVEWSGPFLPQKEIYPYTFRLWVRIRSFLRRLVRQVEGIIWGRHVPDS